MEGRKDQVTGQRRLDGDLGRLQIPDLSDHDHVGILAQDRPQPVGEGEVDLGVDLDLADPLELVLDGILDGDDVLVGGVDPGQGGVKGGGLAASGGSGDQGDPWLW